MSDTPTSTGSDTLSFFSNILTPGSSLHPTFLLILDGAFGALFVILLALFFVTKSIHFIALIAIELGLWASIKWFVYELRNTTIQQAENAEGADLKDQKLKTS